MVRDRKDRYRNCIEPCIQCGKATSLFYQGRPVCVDCDRKRDGTDLSAPVKKPPQMSEDTLKAKGAAVQNKTR